MALHFGGNDYLDLAHHSQVVEAACRATRSYGASTCGSRVSVGTTPLHTELEQALVRFLGCEAAVVLSSGTLAAVAAFDALPREENEPPEIVIDGGAHPSLVTGARAIGGRVRTYRNRDPENLKEILAESLVPADTPDGQPRVAAAVATDAVDGFLGVVTPLSEIGNVARSYGVTLIVDDAHGIGVLGPQGQGSCAAFGLSGNDLVVVGSLAKALASSGGVVAGGGDAIARVRSGPTFVGSTALMPAPTAAALAALELVQEEPQRRTHLIDLAGLLREKLEALCPEFLGPFDTAGPAFPVVTLDLPSAEKAAAIAEELAAEDIHIAHFSYASSGSSSKLRIPLSARHRERDIHRLVKALSTSSLGGEKKA